MTDPTYKALLAHYDLLIEYHTNAAGRMIALSWLLSFTVAFATIALATQTSGGLKVALPLGVLTVLSYILPQWSAERHRVMVMKLTYAQQDLKGLTTLPA